MDKEKLRLRYLRRVLHAPRFLDEIRSAIADLGKRIDALDRALSAEELEMRTMLLRQREISSARRDGPSDPAPSPNADALTFEQSLLELEKLVPDAFRIWHELLTVNANAYDGFPTDSCSVEGHPMGELFRAFLRPYLEGPVLDVGCGPQPVPVYLHGYPTERIAGIDPLPPPAPHPFVFARGVTEFLPWRDRSFQCVVCATSLDHVLLLDRTLDEMKRVMRDDGCLVLWVSFVPGAKPYDPRKKDIQKLDAYHLFHFDRPWFEEMMTKDFAPLEIVTFGRQGPSAFYSYRRKDRPR